MATKLSKVKAYAGKYFAAKNHSKAFNYWDGKVLNHLTIYDLDTRLYRNLKVNAVRGRTDIYIEFNFISAAGNIGPQGRMNLATFNSVYRPATPAEVADLTRRPKTNLVSIAKGLIAGKSVNTKARGGARLNAGRKKKPDATVPVSFRVPASKAEYYKMWITRFIDNQAYIVLRKEYYKSA